MIIVSILLDVILDGAANVLFKNELLAFSSALAVKIIIQRALQTKEKQSLMAELVEYYIEFLIESLLFFKPYSYALVDKIAQAISSRVLT